MRYLAILFFLSCAGMPVKREIPRHRFYSDHVCPQTNFDQCSENVSSILSILNAVGESLIAKKPSALIPFIHPDKGIYIDLKALWSIEKFRQDAQSNSGHIGIFYLDTEKLRRHTGDRTQIAVRDILAKSGRIRAEFFFEDDGNLCEIRLHLIDHPKLNFYLNNPVFIKIDSRWYLYRLF